MLKYVVASVLLIVGFAGTAPAAPVAPGGDDCVNCAPQKPYDTEAPARIRQEMDRRDANTSAPVEERAPDADRLPRLRHIARIARR